MRRIRQAGIYVPSTEDEKKVVSWQYCPYCAEDGEPPGPEALRGNRFAYYEGDNHYKCSFCGNIFERKEVRRIGGGRAMGKVSALRQEKERRSEMQEMYKIYVVEFVINERICGGIPKEGEMIKAWVEAKTGYDDDRAQKIMEETSAQVATDEIEGEKEKRSWNTFKCDDQGLYIEARQIKALLKECANILKGTKGAEPIIDIRNLKHKLAERVFVEPSRISLGVREPTGHIERGIHVWTAQGPRDAIKRVDYVWEPIVKFRLRVLNDGLITEDVLRTVLLHGEHIGLGADRSQGEGKFRMERFDLTSPSEPDRAK